MIFAEKFDIKNQQEKTMVISFDSFALQFKDYTDVTTTIRTYNSVGRSYFKQATKKIDAMFGGGTEM